MNEFICRSGVPSQLHSDQGTNFESNVFVEVCRLLDIEKTGVTPLYPQSDGQVERPPTPPGGEAFQQNSHSNVTWEDPAGLSRLGYTACSLHNSLCLGAVHESAGVSPYLLMLARELRVYHDVYLSIRTVLKLFARECA